VRTSRLIHVTLAATVLAAPLLPAQGRGGRGGAAAPDTSFGVSWRNLGPNQSGRMVAVAGSTARPDEYYMGTTGGGVWKTTDGGKTVQPVTDAYFGGTIGSIDVQQSNPDVVWVGGGETPIRGNVSHGDGVWKSTDAGKSWQYMGLRETQYISRVRIHPGNPDIVYVGALGHVFGPNKERGVYRTTDGGKTWKNILFRNDSTGVADMIMDPSDPKIIYVTFWQAGRTPWSLVSGGAHSGIFKTTDGGDTWTEITRNSGLPKSGPLGAIGITVSPAKPSRLWAIIEHEPEGGVYRSDDAGATWTFMTGDRNLRQRSWYYSKLYADPKDTNVVYAPQVSPLVSKDGGKTFTRGFGGGDNHDIWIDPTNPKRIAVAHDNGLIVTKDGGGADQVRVAAPTGQYYHVHLTNHFPFHVCGAKQDAGSSCGPVRAAVGGGGRGGFGGPGGPAPAAAGGFSEFYGVAGGESGYISSNPKDPDIMYGANYGGSMDRLNRRTGKSDAIDPWPLNPMGHDAKDSKYRFQWTYPIVHSPHDANTIYVGSNVVFRSTNGGTTWTPISKDLTRNDPRTLGSSGGPITKDQTSVEYYGTVFTIAESKLTKGLIWTGSDDGLIHVSRDNGVTFRNVTPKGLPEWMRWSIIEASPHNPGTAWAAGNRYQMDDFTPYLYKTTDYGVTWTKITNGINAEHFTRAIREDLHRPGMVYAATERGVYVSYDAGANWQSLQKNLPPVPVHDMMLRDDDLAIATHGRAFWVMENLTPLRWAPDADKATAAPYLYKPVPVYRLNGQAQPTFTYRLPADSTVVKFEFYDAAGKLVGTAASNDTTAAAPAGRGGGGFGGFAGPAKPGNRKGVNRFTYTMRHENAKTFRGMITWAGSGNGPAMAPGTYRVRMTAGTSAPISYDFRLLPDPRAEATEADLKEQVRFALEVQQKITKANEGVIESRNLKTELTDRKPKMSSDATFGSMADAFAGSLSVVEDSLYQTKNQSGQDPLNFPIRLNDQLGGLMGFITSGERRPPKQAYDVWAVLGPKTDAELTKMETVITTNLPKINAKLKAAGQKEITRSKTETPARPIVP
jgi:photosystem II stability/assembly factor-like uncharacterized protein